MDAMDRIFSAEGPLARAIPAYKMRAQQVEMARAVARAIEARGVLIAEAGTGTGKTFAYLAPALLSGGKVIVSTGTKTLQDQLFARDIPTVREALPNKLFMAWFGPKGVASMLFALFVLGSTDVNRTLVFEIASFTILSSIVAHGLTDTLGANALARWLGRDDAARSYAKA